MPAHDCGEKPPFRKRWLEENHLDRVENSGKWPAMTSCMNIAARRGSPSIHNLLCNSPRLCAMPSTASGELTDTTRRRSNFEGQELTRALSNAISITGTSSSKAKQDDHDWRQDLNGVQDHDKHYRQHDATNYRRSTGVLCWHEIRRSSLHGGTIMSSAPELDRVDQANIAALRKEAESTVAARIWAVRRGA